MRRGAWKAVCDGGGAKGEEEKREFSWVRNGRTYFFTSDTIKGTCNVLVYTNRVIHRCSHVFSCKLGMDASATAAHAIQCSSDECIIRDRLARVPTLVSCSFCCSWGWGNLGLRGRGTRRGKEERVAVGKSFILPHTKHSTFCPPPPSTPTPPIFAHTKPWNIKSWNSKLWNSKRWNI